MSLLRVEGGPVAPADKTLVGATLHCTIMGEYADGLQRYAQHHRAEWDVTYSRWTPQGAADGVRFVLPGAIAGEPQPPCTRFEETQVYGDGTTQTRAWLEQVIGRDGSPPAWDYGAAAPGTPLVIG